MRLRPPCDSDRLCRPTYGRSVALKFVIGVILGFLIGYQLGRSGESLSGSAGRLGQSSVDRARSGIQARLARDGEATR